jgi:hypothetical protein
LRSKREENTFLFFKKYEKESCKKAINYFESDLLNAQNRDDNGKKIMEARKNPYTFYSSGLSIWIHSIQLLIPAIRRLFSDSMILVG